MINIFDTTIRVSHTIKQVHPLYLPNLKFPEDLCLSSLGLLSDYVCEMREKIRFGFKMAIIPLLGYAKAFDCHIPLFILDVQEYIEYVFIFFVLKFPDKFCVVLHENRRL